MSGRAAVPDYLHPSVEQALAECGRDRVMHRSGTEPSVAIRWDGEQKITAPDGTERYLVRTGETLDEAGELAAKAFAQRVLEQSAALKIWADRIEAALKRGAR